MAKLNFSTKRLQIDKANSIIVIVVAVASVVSIFSLVASRALLSQRSYQSRVITEKEKAAKQLKENLEAVKNLQASYDQFVGEAPNRIGGDPSGDGDNDGDNATIVLDALPSKYDFPGLASSLGKLLDEQGFKFENFTGTDDELLQSAQTATPAPTPIEIPFQFTVNENYDSLFTLINAMERSIRPFQITALTLSGKDEQTQMLVSARTYYQPAKSLDITTKDVK